MDQLVEKAQAFYRQHFIDQSSNAETFTWRRSWIAKRSPSLSETFEEYPRFLDMPTLLDTEFGKMFEGKGDLFLRRWEATIIPKLKAIAIMETD